jgi:hypothetical protein
VTLITYIFYINNMGATVIEISLFNLPGLTAVKEQSRISNESMLLKSLKKVTIDDS